MPWPKGEPRKGHINKNGQPHGKWGQALPPQVAVRIQELRSRAQAIHTAPATTAKTQRRKYSTPLAHSQYSIEQCPNCEFPEADGGYCPDCGWSQAVIYGVAF